MHTSRQDLPSPRRASPLGFGIPILLLAVSCSRQAPNAPALEGIYSARTLAAAGAAPNGAFFPLQIGNHWRAEANAYYRTEPLQGPPYDELRIHTNFTRNLIGTETLLDRPYVVLQETWTENDPFTGEPRTGTYWTRYRQDASGLYEADIAATTPPNLDTSAGAIAVSPVSSSMPVAMRSLPATLTVSIPEEEIVAFEAAWERTRVRAEVVRSAFQKSDPAITFQGSRRGLLPGEITRLHYPLHPGTSWVIRPNPLFSSKVEAIEKLTLLAGRFPAYRIRIDNEALGPADFVHLWIGRSGQLALRYHLESEATDSDGNVIGRVIYDYDEVLHELSLVKP